MACLTATYSDYLLELVIARGQEVHLREEMGEGCEKWCARDRKLGWDQLWKESEEGKCKIVGESFYSISVHVGVACGYVSSRAMATLVA